MKVGDEVKTREPNWPDVYTIIEIEGFRIWLKGIAGYWISDQLIPIENGPKVGFLIED